MTRVSYHTPGASSDEYPQPSLLQNDVKNTNAASELPRPAAVAPEEYTQPYLDFMTSNPTVFHAVAFWVERFTAAGYTALSERESWTKTVKPGGKYFVTRNGSSFMAFIVGKNYKAGNGVGIVAGHCDALTARLKPVSTLPNKAGYMQLAVAPYSGGMSTTWWDRDLGIGGKVLLKDSKGNIETKLVKLDWPIARIPTLAPHFGTPSRGPFNLETQAVPIIGLDNSDILGTATSTSTTIKPGTFASTQPEALVRTIAKALDITDIDSIANWELELFDIAPARLGGLNKEFIFAGRLDDKLCCYAAAEALLVSDENSSDEIVKMACCFDNEEIGSLLRQGANSNFLPSLLKRITESVSDDGKYSSNSYAQMLANSFLVSTDVTHAVNPNFLGAYLTNHAPRLNVGLAIKLDPNGHTTSDSVSSTFIRSVAEKCGSTVQIFHIRNDSRSGGTIGPMTSSALGMRAVDVGIPQLSMHSIRGTTGSLDPGLGVKLYKGFYDYFSEVDAQFTE